MVYYYRDTDDHTRSVQLVKERRRWLCNEKRRKMRTRLQRPDRDWKRTAEYPKLHNDERCLIKMACTEMQTSKMTPTSRLPQVFGVQRESQEEHRNKMKGWVFYSCERTYGRSQTKKENTHFYPAVSSFLIYVKGTQKSSSLSLELKRIIKSFFKGLNLYKSRPHFFYFFLRFTSSTVCFWNRAARYQSFHFSSEKRPH